MPGVEPEAPTTTDLDDFMNLDVGSKTDVGRVRKTNQDSLGVLGADRLGTAADGLFVVADGMGGHAGGEVASALAVESVTAEVAAALNGPAHLAGDALPDALERALVAANTAVRRRAADDPDLNRMGTTCVCAVVKDATAVVANVGDSRAYLLRSGELRQITEDHSLVQEYVRHGDMTAAEARESRFRNMITRAIGIEDSLAADLTTVRLLDGDILLLCSDGLHGMVVDDEMAEILCGERDAQSACDELVKRANHYGGQDNITAVVIRVGDAAPAAEGPASERAHYNLDLSGGTERPKPRRSSLPAITAVLACLVVALAGALFAVAKGGYALGPRWPFLQRPPAAKPAPQLDLGQVTYRPPEVVLRDAVRGTPLACDAAGNVYVTLQSGKITRVGTDGTTGGEFIAAPPLPKQAASTQWACDSQGYLYVSSRTERCIFKYRPSGTRVGIIGRGQLVAPAGVAVDAAGDIYVADHGQLKVLRAVPGGTVGSR